MNQEERNEAWIGRTQEISYLEQLYQKPGKNIVVFYGKKNIGKTSLLLRFAKNRPFFYYLAKPFWRENPIELWEQEANTGNNSGEKPIFILDEFSCLLKSDSAFAEELLSFAEHAGRDMLLILVSSSISFVENSMVARLGRTSFALSGLYKMKELSFQEVSGWFSESSMEENLTMEDQLTIYAIAGGNPGLLSKFRKEKTLKENILELILKKDSPFYFWGSYVLLEELRETNVYNTILTAISMGKEKLNDIYEYTGFSRAKISVYLKNLMELELVEKVFSYDTLGRENTKKGVYRIKDHFARFWYTFIFPNMSELTLLCEEAFYDTYIAPGLEAYTALYFKELCVWYLLEQNRKEGKETFFKKTGEWIGKNGVIDWVAEDNNGQTFTCFCKFSEEALQYSEYKKNLLQIKNARIKSSIIYLFSESGFSEEVKAEEENQENLHLISMADMRGYLV